MAGRYDQGTLDATNGSDIVSGNGTDWYNNVAVGDSIQINSETVAYKIAHVFGPADERMQLDRPYAGVTATDLPYETLADLEQMPQGAASPRSATGAKGETGATGAPGTAATADAGTTTTVAPGTPADVRNVGTTSAAVFDFDIPQGIQGEQGDPGQAIKETFYFSTNNTMADPGPGYIRTNSNALQNTDEIAISKTNYNGETISEAFDRAAAGDYLVMRDVNRDKVGLFRMRDASVDNTTWWLAPVESLSSGSEFTDNDITELLWFPSIDNAVSRNRYVDPASFTITKSGYSDTEIIRNASAAATYTIGSLANNGWDDLDNILIVTSESVDVTVASQAAGANFLLPDGTYATTLEMTTSGRTELMKRGDTDDVWFVVQQ